MSYEEKTQKYSTWGDKLLQHTDVLDSIQNKKKFKPITIQLAPCETCDSDCPFCSVARRPLKSAMTYDEIDKLLWDFKSLGAKSVEITGGGNPLLWRDRKAKKNINDIIELCGTLGYDVGIITNTEKLERHLDPRVYEHIDWIRISLIKLDEGKEPEDFDFGSFPIDRIGLSYIIYDGTGGVPDECSRTKKPYIGTTAETIKRIARLIELNPEIKFCRLAGDCLKPDRHYIVHEKYGDIVKQLNKLDKFFIKEIWGKSTPFKEGCYVGLVRPYIAPHPDGGDYQVYACTSHVLENRTYDMDFSLGSIHDVKKIWDDANRKYEKVGYPYEVRGNKGIDWCASCSNCYYHNNNKILHTVAQKMVDRNFA